VVGIKRPREKRYRCRGCGKPYAYPALLSKHEQKCSEVTSQASTAELLTTMEAKNKKVPLLPCACGFASSLVWIVPSMLPLAPPLSCPPVCP
jgi:hypothetical protein